MKKVLISLLAVFGLWSNAALAAEPPSAQFATIFQFSTNQEPAVVAALAEFAQSDCRKQMPTAIRAMRESFNGTEEATHSVIWNFAEAADITTTFGMASQCKEWATFLAKLNDTVDPYSQILTRTLVSGGDPSKDTTYTIWQMNISDEATYVAEYNKLMDKQIADGLINGAYGLIRLQGGADTSITHLAYAGAADLATLMSNANPSQAFMTFQKNVASIRTVQRQNVNTVVADL